MTSRWHAKLKNSHAAWHVGTPIWNFGTPFGTFSRLLARKTGRLTGFWHATQALWYVNHAGTQTRMERDLANFFTWRPEFVSNIL